VWVIRRIGRGGGEGTWIAGMAEIQKQKRSASTLKECPFVRRGKGGLLADWKGREGTLSRDKEKHEKRADKRLA